MLFRPVSLHLGARVRAATYIGSATTSKPAGGSTINVASLLPAEARAGDIYVAMVATVPAVGGTLTGPSGASTGAMSASGSTARVFAGVLANTFDFSFGGTSQEMIVTFGIWRGPTSAVVMASGTDGGFGPGSISYAKTATGVAAVACFLYVGSAVTTTEPSGFTSRIAQALGGYGDEISDLLDLSGYSGSSLSFGLSSNRFFAMAAVELRD